MRDRRSYPRRRALVRRIIDEVFSQRLLALHAVDCARLFGITEGACARILHELEAAGIVVQPRPGIWMRRMPASPPA